jgi:glycerophosphoryl diester phosphodiesterase
MDSFKVSDFSIGHRGACLQFPEHTLESYEAAIWMGAGIVECDVAFTADRQLVCRHAQCDLHTTTDVVTRPELNAKCTTPFVNGTDVAPLCCTSDFTLEEIKTMCAKMDSFGFLGGTAEEYAYGGTAAWRTDLYQYECPRVPTHKESIELIKGANLKFTPELKTPEVEMPFEGDYTQQMYAQQMIDEYIEAGVPPENVWPQSFLHDDVYYWIDNTDFGAQAVALDDQEDLDAAGFNALFDELVAGGAKIVAPPMWRLVEADESAELRMKPSQYAIDAKAKGLAIITWTLERAGPGLDDWYWQTLSGLEADGVSGLVEGDKYNLLHVLAFDVGVLGVFSDWPATTTFFANCYNLGLSGAEPEVGDESVGAESEDGGESVGEEPEDGGEETVVSLGEDTNGGSSGGALTSLAYAGGLISIFVTAMCL